MRTAQATPGLQTARSFSSQANTTTNSVRWHATSSSVERQQRERQRCFDCEMDREGGHQINNAPEAVCWLCANLNLDYPAHLTDQSAFTRSPSQSAETAIRNPLNSAGPKLPRPSLRRATSSPAMPTKSALSCVVGTCSRLKAAAASLMLLLPPPARFGFVGLYGSGLLFASLVSAERVHLLDDLEEMMSAGKLPSSSPHRDGIGLLVRCSPFKRRDSDSEGREARSRVMAGGLRLLVPRG